MFERLEKIEPQDCRVDALVALFDELRPPNPNDGQRARINILALCGYLQTQPEQAWRLRCYILTLLKNRRHTSLYTDIGILSNDGFFTELLRRAAYRFLPPAFGDIHLSDALDLVLHLKTDCRWIAAVPADDWLTLFDLLSAARSSTQPDVLITDGNVVLDGMLEAIRTLSYRICAIGLEPRLIRMHPDIEKHASPFLVQNVEVNSYLEAYRLALADPTLIRPDSSHLDVMLDQCSEIIAKIRRNALQLGTSIALTYLLLVVDQSIARIRRLVYLVDIGPEHGTASDRIAKLTPELRRHAAVDLALELIKAHGNKYAVHELFTKTIDLLARNVTENASRTGEHYIAENRLESWRMLYAAAGAGAVIGVMAMLKIMASYLRPAPLVGAFLYSMNYSVGFMLIHVLHFTVATKQPAMTASRIAAGLHSTDGRHIDLVSMVDLILKVLRTQLIAVLGNVAIAMPMAGLVAVLYAQFSGHALVSVDKANHLLHDLNPFTSLALFHAMIAGVCLFLSGLISGYYDNKALYSRMGQRINQLRSLRRLLGAARLERLGQYIEANLGALMGNLYFGVLLGSIGTLGDMLGLPIDIRHIAFSSANFATAVVGLDYQLSWQTVVISLFGILCIGSLNLVVSFGLALWVALRSRHIRFRQSLQLLGMLRKRIFRRGN